MLARWTGLAVLSLVLSVPGRAEEAPLHGACVLHLDSWEGDYDGPAARALFESLAERGARAVALSAFAWQDDLASTTLRPWDGRTEARADLARAIDAARAAGLAVLLKPHVEIGRDGRRDERAWRGNIRFENAERARAWFASYRGFLVDLARLAADRQVEVLAVGLELAGLSQAWPEEWTKLIAAVRAVHDGPLTYCANWWGEFGSTSLWSELDLLGVQAFAPLAPGRGAELERLRRGAREQLEAWKDESRKWGKPLLITEYGFKSSPAPWVEPWQWKPGPARPEHQLLAYRALLGELDEARGPWLAGSFVWLYEAGRPSPGPEDGGFSPGGKPAEGVLEAWWKGERIGAEGR